LLGETGQVVMGLRVGDRGRHELGESGKTLFCVRRERVLGRRPRDDEPPQPAFDVDRRADG
jgi:hypothetical protein